jgi:hypothetical protein
MRRSWLIRGGLAAGAALILLIQPIAAQARPDRIDSSRLD